MMIIANPKITVIDSLMGSGKTSWSIQKMNEDVGQNYLYITPYLAEVDRIKVATYMPFYDPKPYNGKKIDHFHELLTDGMNIVSTHSLFRMATDKTQELLKKGNYILILDEVLDVVETYTEKNKKGEDEQFKKGDIEFLLSQDLITIDTITGYISWNKEKQYSDYKYEEFSNCAKNNCLIYVDGTVLIWEFPPQILALFKEIYINTYLFKGQIMRAYLDYHSFTYEYKSVQVVDNGQKKYILTEYNSSNEDRGKYKELINICLDQKINALGSKEHALSANWYKKRKKEKGQPEIKALKLNLLNYFTNKVNGQSNTKMWTTFVEFEKDLRGQGFIKAYSLERNKNYSSAEIQKSNCFVPINARATNIYADRFNLAYMINKYLQPYYKKFFSYKNIEIDEETYAISEMLQWIWRSRIRNDEPINIYIPSRRMRELLLQWMNNEEVVKMNL